MNDRKDALVTGASRGLGLEIARALAVRGHRVTLVARSADRLHEVISDLPGGDHRAWPLDLASRSDTHDLLHRIEANAFDIVVNNAGATTFGPLATLPSDVVEAVAWLNFTAPALIASRFLAGAARGATLVNVTSIVATVPMPGNTIYSAAKAGLRALSEGLWFEGRERGVRVIEFRPVSLKTAFHEHAGRGSLAANGAGIDAAEAAGQLVALLDRRDPMVGGMGMSGRILGLMNRVLPRRMLVGMLGGRAARAGYLSAAAAGDPAVRAQPR